MIRALLLAVMMFLVARAFWQVVDGIMAALGGTDTRQKPRNQAVKLVRDPVCGTYVTPRSALSVTDRSGATYYFCSDRCRTQFQKKTQATHATGGIRQRMSSRIEEQIRADIVEAGRRMYARGYVASNDGNISARLDEKRIITTPKSVSKGFMTPDMMVIVDHDGRKVAGDRDASTELPMHLEVYRQRPDVNAVCHAHPPLATGFAVAGIPLTRAVLAEVITTLGSIPIAEYGTPSTAELPEAVRKYIKAHDGMLLANHGAVTCGPNVMAAYYKMETIEHFAKISLVARLLGREHLISREEVERLQGLRGFYGIPAPAPLCTDPVDAVGDQATCQVLEAPESTERLVPDVSAPSWRDGDLETALRQVRAAAASAQRGGSDAEIRLTYGELTALIADAVKNLRD